jgi:hypothetical protein
MIGSPLTLKPGAQQDGNVGETTERISARFK